MNGKQLKEWAAQVPDGAVIHVQEFGYTQWKDDFSIRFTLQSVWDFRSHQEVNTSDQCK